MISKKETTELLKKLVSISSPYFSEDEIMDYVWQWFHERGMEAAVHEYHEPKVTGFHGKNVLFNLVGQEPGPHICLNGHLDTVMLCGGWSREPYGQVEKATESGEGDRLYGVGALDMKSGCAANMMALEAFFRNHKVFKGKISASFVSVEEGPCGIGTNALIEEGYLDGVDFSIITEPSAGFSGVPFPNLCLGARGGYGLEIELFGKSSHAALPQLGVSAAVDAAKVIAQLENVSYVRDPHLGTGTACVVAVECDGGACSVPDYGKIKLFWHIVEGESDASIHDQVEKAIKRAQIQCDYKINFREGPTDDSRGFMPYTVEETDPMVEEFMNSVESVCEKKPSISYFQSIGDFNYLGSRLGAPAVIFGAAGASFHGRDEYVELDTVVKTAQVVYDFLVRTLTAH